MGQKSYHTKEQSMRVFVTGATGGIGSVVVPELLSAGHQVIGLARSERSAAALQAAGASAVSGDLTTLDVLRDAARAADGVIHLAFSNDFTRFQESAEEEGTALAAIGEVLIGSGKPLVLASGTPAVPGRLSTEDDQLPSEGPIGGRGRTALAALALADQGVRPSVVRLPRSVHDRGGPYGFAGLLIEAAQRSGISGYVGDGSQRWPAVNRRDAAVLFRLALEQAEPGEALHAVGDEGDTMLSIAETIGRQLDLPVQPLPADGFGFLGQMFALDQPASSARTRARFGWRPTRPGLLADLAAGDYPAPRSAA
jgi:nucleoside-diphosphate-sugar epimerase